MSFAYRLTGTPGFAGRPISLALGGESGLMNIHAFVKNTDHLNFGVGKKVVENHVTLKRIFAQAWFNVIAGISKLWGIGQHSESIVQSFQVMPPLCSAPTLLSESGNSAQIIFGCMGKRKCTH